MPRNRLKLIQMLHATCLILGFVFSTSIAAAQGLIRDSEIENTLDMVLLPLLKTSGVGSSRVEIFIVADNRLNAFVAGGSNIFINAGLIRKMKNVEMLQAVMAHELAHITNGHLAQRAASLGSARTAAGIGLAIGVAAAAAGGGAGVALGLQEAVQRSMLAFSRSQESSADASSVRFMTNAGISPQASVDVLNLFKGQQALNITRQDPYVQSHPLTSDRISRMRAAAAAYKPKPSRQEPNMAYWYARMIAKFNGFTGNPSYVLRRIKSSDKGEIATMTRAIAYHRLPKPKKAIAAVTRLTQMRPKDPYYHELRGQILLENGQAKAAVNAYRRAASLAPKESLILGGLGHALLSLNSKSSNQEALRVLKKAYARDSRDTYLLRNLAMAYARSGQNGQASAATAERYALVSNFKQAEIHAKRAQGLLPRGSVGWLRSSDILAIAKKLNSKKKKKR